MRFLRIGFRTIRQRLFRQIFFAKLLFNIFTDCDDGFLTQVRGVGTHVGNVPCFVQTLRHHHGFFHTKAQARTGCLL